MPYKPKGNRLVNEVTLGDGYPLSSNLKPLKVGGKTSPVEMSTAYPDDSVKAKVKINGDLEVVGSTKGNFYTQTWSWSGGGSKSNNNSATTYYTRTDAGSSFFTDLDTSPTTTDVDLATTAPVFVTIKPTIITHFNFTGYATDTGATDPFKFYIYSGQPVADATNVILKSIWTSSTMTPADASEVIVLNEELEVHVGANQRLYCFYKKDSTSGNQDLYFSAQISGYYTK